MLVSFHEYERELIAERVKDKMSAARKRGMYVGSIPPLGYHVKNKRLVVDEREAERVREIFDLYSQGLSPHEVAQEINRRGWRTKEWVSRKGNRFGGKPFDKYHLARILHNVTYVAKIEYEGEVYDGEHEAIVDEDLWRRVHAKLLERSVGHRIRQRSDATLRGLLRCKACAASMTPSFSTKGSRRYQYYRCVRANRRGAETCPSKSLPAAEIEGFVVDELAKYLKRRRLTDAVESLTNGQRSAVVRRWVEKVVYDGEKERIAITFREPEEIA
jgi:site-specific DNA recombinase